MEWNGKDLYTEERKYERQNDRTTGGRAIFAHGVVPKWLNTRRNLSPIFPFSCMVMANQWMRGHLHSLCVIVQRFIIDQIRDRNPICIPSSASGMDNERSEVRSSSIEPGSPR